MIELIHGDCLEVMRGLEAGSVDAVATDPPYGVGIAYNQFDDTKANLARLIAKFMPEVLRISSCVLITCGNGNQHLYPLPDWTLCWHIPAGNGYNAWGFTTWQPILAYGKPHRERGRAQPDSISMSPRSAKNEHPCPKPDKLMTTIIQRYTAEDWTILDPFMGSGTTGVACVQTGRSFIGIEIDAGYFEIAQRRIAEAQLQPRLPGIAQDDAAAPAQLPMAL